MNPIHEYVYDLLGYIYINNLKVLLKPCLPCFYKVNRMYVGNLNINLITLMVF